MSCNNQIHDELKNMGESICPFCDQLLVEVNKAIESCCSEQDMETVKGMNICVNCGLVHGYDYAAENFDFYDKMYSIRRKLVYHRNYHIDNVMNGISFQLTLKQKDQIHKIFVEINSVLHEVNDERKRIISIKFILKQLFRMLGLPYKDIQVTKLKRTLKYYEQYWEEVQLLIGDRIQSIINM